MKKVAVINVVGLSKHLLNSDGLSFLKSYFQDGSTSLIKPVSPAVTSSTQATYLTGKLPSDHGIVGNGWYFKELAQVWLWRQVNSLIQSEKIWDEARKKNPEFKSANLFWWFNMYSSVDYSVTPRPVYRSDGLKLPDIYTEPPTLAHDLQNKLGDFPLFQFWGPGASIKSSQWIADAAREVFEKHQPDLNLVYLPHLDYVLQKEGPNGVSVPHELKSIDQVCQKLIEFYESQNVEVIVLSEYGITEVKQHIPINQFLRKHDYLKVRVECGEDHFDAGASTAFAVCDHQIAHIYIQDKSQIQKIKNQISSLSGIAQILDHETKKHFGLDHERSGDLVLLANSDAWFSYKYWLDDTKAPDFARTVDIHKKPGYDPLELFIDPKIHFPKLKLAWTLIKKKLGFRYLMNVIPLDESLIKGSHGSPFVSEDFWPVLLTKDPNKNMFEPTEIKDLIMRKLQL